MIVIDSAVNAIFAALSTPSSQVSPKDSAIIGRQRDFYAQSAYPSAQEPLNRPALAAPARIALDKISSA